MQSRFAASVLLGMIAGPCPCACTGSTHGTAGSDAAHAGIWKAMVPPEGAMHGEFDNNDPVGLAAGARIAANCSINWTDPDFGKLYCFASATSLVYFLDSPRAFLARAQKTWSGLGPNH